MAGSGAGHLTGLTHLRLRGDYWVLMISLTFSDLLAVSP